MQYKYLKIHFIWVFYTYLQFNILCFILLHLRGNFHLFLNVNQYKYYSIVDYGWTMDISNCILLTHAKM